MTFLMKTILLKILRLLAKNVLKKYRPLVIGVTGSVGKSSAKEAIFSVLQNKFKVRRSQGNYNNEIGAPLAILDSKTGGRKVFKWLDVFFAGLKLIIKKNVDYPEMLVLEMAADKIGDLDYLIKFIPCDVGVVTSVSEVHFERFGSLENIIKEKQKIIAHLKESHLAVLNADDHNVMGMRTLTKAKVATFGFSEEADFRATDVKLSQHDGQIGTTFKLHAKGSVLPVFLYNILGKQQVQAALTAIAVASSLDVKLLDILEGLKKYQPLPGRANLIKGIKGTLLIDDSYNASSISTKAALEILKEMPIVSSAKKVAVFGEMLELGSLSETGHQAVGQKSTEAGVAMLVCVGEKARDIIRGAVQFGLSQEKTFYFDNNYDAGIFVQDKIRPSDIVLIKGSQGARMEQITKELMAEPLLAKQLLVRQNEEWLKK